MFKSQGKGRPRENVGNYPLVDEYMERNDLNLTELAYECGVSQSTMSYILNKRKKPSKKVINRFAELLNVSPEDILGE